ncbi:MAG TPA: hypothetical protein VJJ23_02895 [Candidatus Nanoarchaeia archaeon]|nr:hypothetical protein [Candidatus Nanoarchaeia archaeon]
MYQGKKGHIRLNEERIKLQKRIVKEIFDQEDLEALTKTGLPVSVRHIPKTVLNMAGRSLYNQEAEDYNVQYSIEEDQ